MKLKTNILRVFSANFLTMISGIVVSFLLPKVLSLSSYANLKTYTFYISYITFFSLGFVDGMYIKYGGKQFKEIDKSFFKLEHLVYLVSQIIFSIFFIIASFVLKDTIIFLMAITIVPLNVLGFFKLNYQAMGEFSKYSNISYLYTIIYLMLNIFFVLVLKSNNYIYYCVINLVSNILLFILMEKQNYTELKGVKVIYNKKVWDNIKVGFFVLLGNSAVMLFYGLDRWFIKIFYTEIDFAYYSFALSMLSLINTLVSSVSVTFYNYIAKGENEKFVIKIKRYLLMLGVISSGGFFVFSAIVNIFLKKYIPSLDIIAVSFSAYPYMIVIDALFINLYKSRKQERKYLKVVIKMLLIAILYNFFASMISKNSVIIAIATTLSFITWYIYSSKDFHYLKITKSEFLFLIINLISFLFIAHYFNWILGGLLYLLIIILTIIFLFKKESKEIRDIIINFLG